MHPVLSNAFDACLADLEAVDTTTAQLHPEGRPHAPSIQQSIERHIAVMRHTTELLEKRLKRGRLPRDTRRTRLEWGLQLMILSFGHVPQGTALIDEEFVAPVAFGAMHGRELAKRLSAEIAAFDALLDACRKQFGMERIECHPLLGPMRVDQWRRCEVLQLRALHRTIAGTRESMLQPVAQVSHRTARA